MTAVPLPLRFQIGARTLASIQRRMVRVPMTLDDVLEGRLPALPPLGRDAHGYQITSLPEASRGAMMQAGGGMIAFVRQRYTRHYADLTIGHDDWLATMSPNARSGMKRKAKKVATVSGGALDVRRFRTPDEMAVFHDIARRISARTYQEKLLGSGLPDDAAFLRQMYSMAAADAVRGWLLYVAGEPAAYLYCPVVNGTVRYEYVGHDPAFNELSPGGVLHMEAMRDLYAEGGAEGKLKHFDFTEGEGQHKRQFATGGVACLDLLLFRPSVVNRLTIVALGSFDRTTALGKTVVQKLGLGNLAKKLRRA
ncbi:GNAT family N-acetyltransferase [Sphingomonas alpina]|uniref:GNAT family N-acetyltransferase n=1 Tax=Sphingomonas alpina TaxID=653931 RepID=A0A7H0LEF3_9SPHN|nr:GNAT family N-acetyltransferase [Sphingomonas alpina]QNQ08056.1 GNAT family N-acetyltransferase [Sphingomonas alpina]